MNKKILFAMLAFITILAGCALPLETPTESQTPVNITSDPITPATDKAGSYIFNSGSPVFSKITWLEKEAPITSLKIFTNDYETGSHYYKVGMTDAKGSVIVVKYTPSDYPSYGEFAVLINQDKINYLILGTNFSNSEPFDPASTNTLSYSSGKDTAFDNTKITMDIKTVIPELIPPKEIKSSVGTLTLTSGSPMMFSELLNTKSVGTLPNGNQVFTVQTTQARGGGYWPTFRGTDALVDNGGLYVKAPNQTVWLYRIVPDFAEVNDQNIGASFVTLIIPNIKWNDGTPNKSEYSMTDIGGCGSMNIASVVNDMVDKKDLVESGKTPKDEPIYMIKDTTNNKFFLAFMKAKFPDGIKSYDSGDFSKLKEVSLKDYLKKNPLFFWYDSIGRLIKFESVEFTPPAECGKPVIYLYPQETIKVSVKLNPEGGFTKSEPNYGKGWNVMASPDGSLKEISSGNIYPYLFWEGRGGLYQTPEAGFVIERANVENFLDSKLGILGLNTKEIADFKEFWLPRMTKSPYYFITFMGNETMDKLAPLTVTPKPDSVIRILMDFKGLDKKVIVKEQTIKHRIRKGFAVIEWGGVINE